jgi:hypothetical protein
LQKIGVVWSKNAQVFAKFFGENIFKIIISVPARTRKESNERYLRHFKTDETKPRRVITVLDATAFFTVHRLEPFYFRFISLCVAATQSRYGNASEKMSKINRFEILHHCFALLVLISATWQVWPDCANIFAHWTIVFFKRPFKGRSLNRVQVENFSSSKLEVNKIILIKFATCKFSTWTRFKNRWKLQLLCTF